MDCFQMTATSTPSPVHVRSSLPLEQGTKIVPETPNMEAVLFAGVAVRAFSILAAESINIQMVSTSEIKVSVVAGEKVR